MPNCGKFKWITIPVVSEINAPVNANITNEILLLGTSNTMRFVTNSADKLQRGVFRATEAGKKVCSKKSERIVKTRKLWSRKFFADKISSIIRI